MYEFKNNISKNAILFTEKIQSRSQKTFYDSLNVLKDYINKARDENDLPLNLNSLTLYTGRGQSPFKNCEKIENIIFKGPIYA